MADPARVVVGRPEQWHPVLVDHGACTVSDLHHRRRAEEGLVKADPVVLERVVDADCLGRHRGAVAVQDQRAGIVARRAALVVGVREARGFHRHAGSATDGHGAADRNREAVVAVAEHRADHRPDEDGHDGEVGDDGAKRCPAVLVEVEVCHILLVVAVDDGPIAVGAEDAPGRLGSRGAGCGRVDRLAVGRQFEESAGHPRARMNRSAPECRRALDRAGQDRRRQRDCEAAEPDRLEDREQAELVEDAREATVPGLEALQPDVVRRRVGRQARGRLDDERADQPQPGEAQHQRERQTHRGEHPPQPIERAHRRERRVGVELGDAPWLALESGCS